MANDSGGGYDSDIYGSGQYDPGVGFTATDNGQEGFWGGLANNSAGYSASVAGSDPWIEPQSFSSAFTSPQYQAPIPQTPQFDYNAYAAAAQRAYAAAHPTTSYKGTAGVSADIAAQLAQKDAEFQAQEAEKIREFDQQQHTLQEQLDFQKQLETDKIHQNQQNQVFAAQMEQAKTLAGERGPRNVFQYLYGLHGEAPGGTPIPGWQNLYNGQWAPGSVPGAIDMTPPTIPGSDPNAPNLPVPAGAAAGGGQMGPALYSGAFGDTNGAYQPFSLQDLSALSPALSVGGASSYNTQPVTVTPLGSSTDTGNQLPTQGAPGLVNPGGGWQPNLPGFLQGQFTPQGGVAPVSAQAWGQMNPTQQGALTSWYQDVLGINPDDAANMMKRDAPQANLSAPTSFS